MSRPVNDFNRKKLLIVGSATGAGAVMIALVGMFEGLDQRMLIAPVLSLGYLFFFVLPFVAGYLASKEDILEGLTRFRYVSALEWRT